jgi:hypothetical protein
MNYYSDNTYSLSDGDNDTETDTESMYESDEELIDDLYEQDEIFANEERITNNYYIGICKKYYDYYLLVNTISPRLFYKTPYELSLKYLREYSIIYIHHPQIEIMKLNILQDGTYSVIKKTYWLRLIQRHWKKIMKMKKDIYNKRMSVTSQYSFQIRGRYPYGLNTIPGLVGMLRDYNTKTKCFVLEKVKL